MIRLDGVSKSFGKHRVLKNVSLDFAEHETVAVIGESGTGKSTLGKILLGLVPLTSGSYLFEGVEVSALRGSALRRWRRTVQAVFQNPSLSLNPRMSVGDLVAEPLVIRGDLRAAESRSRAMESLELVGLPTSMASRYPHQLSGGQRQRVAIARAVSVRPRMLVLDEPLAALDMSVRAQVLGVLASLVREYRMTVVFITHDISTMSQLCQRAVVLYRGEVVETNSTKALIENPQHPYSRLLIRSVTHLGEPVAADAEEAA